MSGKVIFSDARCCRSSSFLSLNRKTENALWRRPFSMFVMRWPTGEDIPSQHSVFPLGLRP
jgi:hypothetical protein